MGGMTVKWIRGDGRTLTADGSVWGLTAAEGLDEPNVEIFTQKAATGDGDLVTGRRVGGRTLAFTLKARQAAYNDVLRRAITSFFSASQTYDVYVSRSGDKRYAPGCRPESVEVPLEAVGKPVTAKLTFLLPEGYFLSADSFGQNIAGVEERCGYPFAALAGTGRLYGVYAFAQTVHLQNDGDAEAYCRAVMTARGEVTNPKLIAGSGYVRVLGTLDAGDVLTIDGRTKAVTLNGENASAKLDKTSRFDGIVFQPGISGVGFSADIGSNLLDVYVYYNKRYLGA